MPGGVTCCFLLPAECMPESFLYQDMCHQSCPRGFYKDTRECIPCHEDCLECSGPSADDCDLCAETSLVLYDGWCLDECPVGTYYEKETKDCRGKGLHESDQASPGHLPPQGCLLRQSTCWGLRGSSPGAVIPLVSLRLKKADF